MKNEEPKTTITIDIIYDVSYPPSKDAITHAEIDSSDLSISSVLDRIKVFLPFLSNSL